jgi:hypothetical protein
MSCGSRPVLVPSQRDRLRRATRSHRPRRAMRHRPSTDHTHVPSGTHQPTPAAINTRRPQPRARMPQVGLRESLTFLDERAAAHQPPLALRSITAGTEVSRLAKQLTTLKPGTRPTKESLRQPISVAELLAREDPDRRPEPRTGRPSAELSADTEPVLRPRQRIRLGPPNRTATDPSPWFQPRGTLTRVSLRSDGGAESCS